MLCGWSSYLVFGVADFELQLMSEDVQRVRLRTWLQRVKGQYDWILIDCPPSLHLITVNALAAAVTAPDVRKPGGNRANAKSRNRNKRPEFSDACTCMQYAPCWTCQAWRRVWLGICARRVTV